MPAAGYREEYGRDNICPKDKVINPPKSPFKLVVLSFLCTVFTANITHAQSKPLNNPLPKKILIGGNTTLSSPPYNWIDNCDQSLQGSYRHLLEKALGEMGITAEYAKPLSIQSPKLHRRMVDLDNGTYDALVGVYKRQDNGKMSILSEPLVKIDGGVLFKKKLGHSIQSLLDLKNLNGAMAASKKMFYLTLSNSPLSVADLEALNIQEVRSRKELIQLFKEDEIDYIISDRYRIKSFMLGQNMTGTIDFVSIPEFQRAFYLAIKKGSIWEGLLPVLDEKFKAMHTSGYAKHVENNYLLKWHRQQKCTAKL